MNTNDTNKEDMTHENGVEELAQKLLDTVNDFHTIRTHSSIQPSDQEKKLVIFDAIDLLRSDLDHYLGNGNLPNYSC